MYYINTLKRELVYTNAYRLQPSLSVRVVVDGHCGHTALKFSVKAKENQDKVPTLYWLPKLHKNPIKHDLLLILVLVRQQNFQNCNPRVLQLLKNMLPSTVKRYMRDPVKTYFGLLKIEVKF